MNALSVGEISDILKGCFSNPKFSSLPIYGEVYSIKLGKFSYIELGDQGKTQSSAPLLKCAFSSFQRYSYPLEDVRVGDVILVTGKLSYYAHGSSITLWGDEITLLKSQEGKNLLLKKKTLEKLDKLGYLNPQRKKKIPSYCHKVAILTADTGAAYQDILKTLHDRFPVSSVLYPVTVQGENAAKSMTLALKKAQEGDYDCILLGRGGGSKTDLSCFDDEKLCLAIAESKIPIITCIGHTIDTAIADRVSDYQAITPTEAAGLINPSRMEINDRMSQYKTELNRVFRRYLVEKRMELEDIHQRLEFASPRHRLDSYHQKLEKESKELTSAMKNRISQKRLQWNQDSNVFHHTMNSLLSQKRLELERFSSQLASFDSSEIAKKGYAVIYRDGKKIHSAKEINVNDTLLMTYPDGRVVALVKERK
jgi:exodeoxyribonuclease VII large subunit